MSRKPQSYLPPNSQPWGRYVEESLATLERGTSINGQNSNNNLRQLNSSVQLLSQQQQALEVQQGELEDQQAALAAQQAYLATFTSYISSDPSAVSGTTLGSTTFLRQLGLSFTLSRSAKVLIESTLEYQASLGTPNWSVLWQLSSNFSVSSTGANYGAFNTGTLNATNVPTINKTDGGQARVSRIVDLAAGSHFINASWTYFLFGTSGQMFSQRALVNATVVG